jgi:hypothetical protein
MPGIVAHSNSKWQTTNCLAMVPENSSKRALTARRISILKRFFQNCSMSTHQFLLGCPRSSTLSPGNPCTLQQYLITYSSDFRGGVELPGISQDKPQALSLGKYHLRWRNVGQKPSRCFVRGVATFAVFDFHVTFQVVGNPDILKIFNVSTYCPCKVMSA